MDSAALWQKSFAAMLDRVHNWKPSTESSQPETMSRILHRSEYCVYVLSKARLMPATRSGRNLFAP